MDHLCRIRIERKPAKRTFTFMPTDRSTLYEKKKSDRENINFKEKGHRLLYF